VVIEAVRWKGASADGSGGGLHMQQLPMRDGGLAAGEVWVIVALGIAAAFLILWIVERLGRGPPKE